MTTFTVPRSTALALGVLAILAAPHVTQAATQLDGKPLIACRGSGDGAGNPPTECPVDLVKGQDYSFHTEEVDGDATTVELVNPVGQVTISTHAPGDGNGSIEFRAAYTGTFRVRIRADYEGGEYGDLVEIYTDCRADAKTQCRLPLGVTADIAQTGTGDVDGLLSYLRKGKVYAYTSRPGVYVSLASPTGAKLAQNHTGTLKVRAPATGWYLLDVMYDRGGSSVSLK